MWTPSLQIKIAAPDFRVGQLSSELLGALSPVRLLANLQSKGKTDPHNGSLSIDEMRRVHTEWVSSNLTYNGHALPYTVERLFFTSPHFAAWDYGTMTCERSAANEDLFLTPSSHPLAGDSLIPGLTNAYRGRRWDNLATWGTPAATITTRRLVRITALDDRTVRFAQSDYDTQAVTNHVMDMRLESTSLREVVCDKEGTPQPPLDTKHLANTLGVSVLFLDGATPIMPLRSRHVAVYPNQWGTTVSFSLDFPDNSAAPHALHDLIIRGLEQHLREEIAVERADSIALTPLALCREWIRGGKPQLFFAAKTPLTAGEIQARYARAGHGSDVATTYGFLKMEKAIWTPSTGDQHDFSPKLLAALALVEMHNSSTVRPA